MLPRMVTLLVSSASDIASVNLRQSMLAARTWTPLAATHIEVHHASGERGEVYLMHFTDPATGRCLSAAPCAVSAVTHSVIGSVLAVWWRSRPAGEPPATDKPALPTKGSGHAA